jgi:large subunit ribosomal protein L21
VYAVVQTGGKQHKVRVGQTFEVELLDGAKQAGDTVELDQVLAIGQDDATLIGRPTLEGAKVVAEVVDPLHKGEKILVFKYRNKIRYRRKTGHRQKHTQLKVTDIVTGS